MSLCLFFLGSPKCNAHALRFAMRRRGCMNPLCTFPGGHWIRANIQCGHRKVGCLFKREPSEGARWPPWKRGRNPATRHRNIDRNIYRNPATTASLWSDGLIGPTDQKAKFRCFWIVKMCRYLTTTLDKIVGTL